MVSNENKIKFLQKNKNKNELYQIVKKQANKYKGYSKMKKLDLINLIVNNKNDFLSIHQEIEDNKRLKKLNNELKDAKSELEKLNKIKDKNEEQKQEKIEYLEYIEDLEEDLKTLAK